MPDFTALRVTETPDGQFERTLAIRSSEDLPGGEILIRVQYSALNYKDALSATGHKGVTRRYPHTPGVDAAGVVAHSTATDFRAGDEVLVTGYDLGMNTDGGFGGYIRVPADWVVPRPDGLSLRDCMIYGTAGLTAALCIGKLQHAGVTPAHGDILVTGAGGGVGSLGVALLSRLGYRVTAMSGKAAAEHFLRGLGATAVIPRDALDALDAEPERPLLKSRWAGVLDTVGGTILAAAIRSTQANGHVACCGLTASDKLNLTVYPFILRGVGLSGVDSVNVPMPERRAIWQRLAGAWRLENLAQLAQSCDLASLNGVYIDKILQGQIQGRMVVEL